jgi:hypothetical protein
LLECFEVWLIASADKKYADARDLHRLLRINRFAER